MQAWVFGIPGQSQEAPCSFRVDDIVMPISGKNIRLARKSRNLIGVEACAEHFTQSHNPRSPSTMSHHCHDEAHGHGHGHGHDHDHDHDELPDSDLVHESLYQKIDHDNVTCLNESEPDAGKSVLKPWHEKMDDTKVRYCEGIMVYP